MHAKATNPGRIRKSVRKLLEAIDRAVSASREVERARDALVRESERLEQFRVVGEREGAPDED